MLTVRRVTGGSIHVNAERYVRSLVLTPDEVVGDWHDKPVDDLSETDFAAVIDGSPEIVLLGTGMRNIFPPRDLVFAFARLGIGFEAMDTPAAARTFNVLATEGRRVTAVLYL